MIRSDLDSKLIDAEKLNKSLQSELERVKSNRSASERQLRSELDQITQNGDSSEWKTRYEGLDKVHQDLQGELRQQQITTKEVRQQASGFLNEMKILSERSSQTYQREEALIQKVHGLEEQVQEWKSRYARAKAQLGNLRTSSVPFQQAELEQLGEARDLIKDDGLVLDVHVTQFQLSIDELLRGARAIAPDSLLVQVRQVAVAVRQITQDIGGMDGNKGGQETTKCMNKVSATANNLITATKNFAASKGLSPVSLLDAAASHLTTAMVELIRTAKIRPSPAGALEAEEEEEEEEEEDNSIIAESPGAYYGLAHERMSYGGESIYSSPSPPRQPAALQYPVQGKHAKHEQKHSSGDIRMNGVKGSSHTKLGIGIQEQDDELEELKVSGPLADSMYSC